MCRSEPHTPLASMRTTASWGSVGSGSGRSSTLTTPGDWNVTARMRAQDYPRPAQGAHALAGRSAVSAGCGGDLAQRPRLGIEDEAADVLARGQLAARAQARQAVRERLLDVLEGSQTPRRYHAVGGERPRKVVLGGAMQPAAVVHHHHD